MELLSPNIPHTCMAAVVIVCTMGAMDVYLVEQSAGARRLGVCTLALAGDLFFLLVLRFATVWLGGEARLAQRGYAMVLWFLFAFALEIKLYFIYQHYATEGQAPDPLARHTLTLLLSICIPALYTVLGATELLAQATTSFRKKDELRRRLFWVVLDLLDVLEIQASLWEPQQRVLPLWAEGLTFFYCYGLLLVLPCVSLSELGVQNPHCGTLYPLLSLASVNVATIFIRGGLLLLCHDQRISSIFMGKNFLAIALKSCAVLQHHTGTQAARETCHRCPTCNQSLGRTRTTGEQQHRHVQTTAEIRNRQSTADYSHEYAQTAAGQPSKHTANDQLHEQAKAKASHRNPTVEMPLEQAQVTDEQSHRSAQTTDHQLHRHCCIKESSHYRHTIQHSPRDPTTIGPTTDRALRTGYRVQLKSVWNGP
ncbi:transmembrane protein 121-like [Sphaerodactylus townsendi]|uniref:transmembrane protein 121-like n=1 Tax=Sphaerodactylus townsendi TaxID=933632 RepID=UPI00202701AE|nr:transmembrane protein 121-like [Sphaerodactylus townsendi]XP_048370942.1 transmembrane protein 121-like [Sphaerodactylus townsendi]XP_048370951.1 transmembrane protein 121-like [Sphaerodactylus townsendi]